MVRTSSNTYLTLLAAATLGGAVLLGTRLHTAPRPASVTPATPAPARDFAAEIVRLQARIPEATTAKARTALASSLTQLAYDAHHQNQGKGTLSLSAFDAALALRRAAGDPMGEADVLTQRATTAQMLGRSAETEANLRDALALYARHRPDSLPHAAALYTLAERLAVTGDYDEASRRVDQALRIRQREKDENGQADCLSLLGQIAFEQGRDAIARQWLMDADRIFVRLGKTPAHARTLGQLGDVAQAEGKMVEAERLYRQGLSLWSQAPSGFWIGRFEARLALLCARTDRPVAAERWARQSIAHLAESNGPVAAAWPKMALAEVAAQRGDRAAAGALLAEARALHQKAGRAYGLRQTAEAEARLLR